MQHTSQDIRSTVDEIMARSRARFGHGLWFMEETGAGDSGGDTGGDSGGEQSGGQSGESAGQGGEQGGQSSGQSGSQKTGAEKVEDLPDWAQKLIKDTRGEAAEHRTKATTAEKKATDQLEAIAKALGLKEDEQVDPAKLQKQLGETQASAQQTQIELAVFKRASKNQGDPDALLDSRGFLAKLTDLDPTAKNFTEKVDAAIKEAVKDNPKLKSTQAAGSSSADHGAGGTGEQGKREAKSLDQAVSGHYGTT